LEYYNSGDKDFIPAMKRTRQKARKVGVVSMRTGCNRALYEGTNIKDFDVVWIEEFLDRLVVKMTPEELDARRKPNSRNDITNRGSGLVSPFTMMKVIHDFIENSPSLQVSSRDIGRYLKSITMNDGTINLLDDMKLSFGGLKQFLAERVPAVFNVVNRDWDENRDARDRTFWVEANKDSQKALVEEAERAKFSEPEKTFWSQYKAGEWNVSHTDQPYYHTEVIMASAAAEKKAENSHSTDVRNRNNNNNNNNVALDKAFDVPPELKIDYSKYTVLKLKDVCRDRKLLVSGAKAILLERIEEDIKLHIQVLHKMFQEKQKKEANQRQHQNQQQSRIRMDMTRSKMGSRLISKPNGTPSSTHNNQKNSSRSTPSRSFPNGSNNNNNNNRQSSSSNTNYNNRQPTNVNPAIVQHLEGLVTEYLNVSGGQAGSRDIGRYLAANRVSGVASGNGPKRMTALQELKDNYGSLAHFIGSKSDIFIRARDDTTQSKQDDYGFPITLKK